MCVYQGREDDDTERRYSHSSVVQPLVKFCKALLVSNRNHNTKYDKKIALCLSTGGGWGVGRRGGGGVKGRNKEEVHRQMEKLGEIKGINNEEESDL